LRRVLLGLAQTMYRKKEVVPKDKDSIKNAMKKHMIDFLTLSRKMSDEELNAFLSNCTTMAQKAPTTTEMGAMWRKIYNGL